VYVDPPFLRKLGSWEAEKLGSWGVVFRCGSNFFYGSREKREDEKM